jgi:hypothetical protein
MRGLRALPHIVIALKSATPSIMDAVFPLCGWLSATEASGVGARLPRLSLTLTRAQYQWQSGGLIAVSGGLTAVSEGLSLGLAQAGLDDFTMAYHYGGLGLRACNTMIILPSVRLVCSVAGVDPAICWCIYWR